MRKKSLFLLLFLLVFSSYALAQKSLPAIVRIEGMVFTKDSADQWVAAQENMMLKVETVLKTAEESWCDIALDSTGTNIVSIGPETEIILRKFLIQVEIKEGRVFSLIENLSEDVTFEVKTPTATCGARGTAWEVVVKNDTQINVLKNTVYIIGFTSKGVESSRIDLKEGFFVVVDENGQIGSPLDLSKDNKKRLNRWMSSIKGRRNQWRDVLSQYSGQNPNLLRDILKMELKNEMEQGADVPYYDDDSDRESPWNRMISDDITRQTFNEPRSTDTSSQQEDIDSGSGYDVAP